jgi:hypothetical protein
MCEHCPHDIEIISEPFDITHENLYEFILEHDPKFKILKSQASPLSEQEIFELNDELNDVTVKLVYDLQQVIYKFAVENLTQHDLTFRNPDLSE